MFFIQKNFSSKIGIQPKNFCTLNFGMVWVIMVSYGFVFIILGPTFFSLIVWEQNFWDQSFSGTNIFQEKNFEDQFFWDQIMFSSSAPIEA